MDLGTPPKAFRDSKFTAQAHERDGVCVLTKVSHQKNVQIAHIYPFSMSAYIDDPTQQNTW